MSAANEETNPVERVVILPYFHEEVDKERFDEFKKEGKTWGQLKSEYQQPKWCQYPDALGGMMGCWSLVGCLITDEDCCKTCDCYKSI